MKILYVYGSGHSGSTLLTMLLNGHSAMIGLSEVIHINTSFMTETDAHREFWQAVARRYEAITGRPFTTLDIGTPSGTAVLRWTHHQVHEWAERNRLMLDAVSDTARKQILVDASKHWQRLYALQRSEGFDLKVIHLVRDGRAVLNSYLRKRVSFAHGVRSWLTPSIAALPLRRLIPADRWLEVRYETLAAEPAATLSRICDFVGLQYEPQMLDFRAHPWIGILGNGMRKRSDDRTIASDVRWRSELPTAALVKFSLVGGPLNRYYGYPLRRPAAAKARAGEAARGGVS